MITDLGRSAGAEKQRRRLAAMPPSLRTLFSRAYAKNCSPRAAIKDLPALALSAIPKAS